MKMKKWTVLFSEGHVRRLAGLGIALTVVAVLRAQDDPPPAPAPLSVIVSGPVDVRGSVDTLNDAFRTPFNSNVTGTRATGVLRSVGAINVPIGKRLVIETISVRVRVPAGQRVLTHLEGTPAAGTRPGFECPLELQFEGTFDREDVFCGTHRIRLVIDRRTVSQLEFNVSRSANFSTASFTAFLGGYLEDEPIQAN